MRSTEELEISKVDAFQEEKEEEEVKEDWKIFQLIESKIRLKEDLEGKKEKCGCGDFWRPDCSGRFLLFSTGDCDILAKIDSIKKFTLKNYFSLAYLEASECNSLYDYATLKVF